MTFSITGSLSSSKYKRVVIVLNEVFLHICLRLSMEFSVILIATGKCKFTMANYAHTKNRTALSTEFTVIVVVTGTANLRR